MYFFSASFLNHMRHIMRKPVYAVCEQRHTDQPAHLRSLISAFVACCLDSTTPILAISRMSRL